MADTSKSLDTLLDERLKLNEQKQQSQQQHQTSQSSENGGTPTASAPLPPTMQKAKDTSVDDLLKEMNRIPLFMTSLDDESAEDNPELEALRALAYEGTRAEIAQNFREQGTELVKLEKRWREAREYYSKAIKALKAPRKKGGEEWGLQEPEMGPKVVEVEDEEAEEKKEREIEEVCLVNRALCNLEMKNYGSCNRDCAAALRLNPRNIKAWYRAASACLSLDKIPESLDACTSGLKYDPTNPSLTALKTRIEARQTHLNSMAQLRKEREERLKLEAATLKLALRSRGIPTRETETKPEIPESAVALADPKDPASALSFPVMLLYPAHAQTDFVKAFGEAEVLGEHLEYIFPLPWDEPGEYSVDGVEAYMETKEAGLVKVGKKVALGKVLGGGKVEVVDGLVRINVLPKAKVGTWVEEFKARRGK